MTWIRKRPIRRCTASPSIFGLPILDWSTPLKIVISHGYVNVYHTFPGVLRRDRIQIVEWRRATHPAAAEAALGRRPCWQSLPATVEGGRTERLGQNTKLGFWWPCTGSVIGAHYVEKIITGISSRFNPKSWQWGKQTIFSWKMSSGIIPQTRGTWLSAMSNQPIDVLNDCDTIAIDKVKKSELLSFRFQNVSHMSILLYMKYYEILVMRYAYRHFGPFTLLWKYTMELKLQQTLRIWPSRTQTVLGYVCTYTNVMYICIYVYMYICIYVYMYMCIYVYVYICICIYIYMYMCIYVYMYICIYIYMRVLRHKISCILQMYPWILKAS